MEGRWEFKCNNCGEKHYIEFQEFNPAVDSQISGVGCSYDKNYCGTYNRDRFSFNTDQNENINRWVVTISSPIPICEEIKTTIFFACIELPYSGSIVFSDKKTWLMRDIEKMFQSKRDEAKGRKQKHENDVARAVIEWASRCNARCKNIGVHGRNQRKMVIQLKFSDIKDLVLFQRLLFEKVSANLVVR